jgi:mono/diheme cytochrome c family protein
MRRSIRGALAIAATAAAALALLGAGAGTAGHKVTYALPDEQPIALPSGPGAELTQGTCSACHSLDYIRIQPPHKGAQFWHDEVAKMGKAYGARIAPADAEQIAAYLGQTYGK